jgi:4-alpha-glucanotransferase
LVNSEEAASALIELAWSSVAALTIAPLQDVFALGAESRMNVPGRADGNWRWRFQRENSARKRVQMAGRFDK